MKFKTWLESLAGPGSGPDPKPMDLVRYYQNLASKGAGAFPVTGNLPITKKHKYLKKN